MKCPTIVVGADGTASPGDDQGAAALGEHAGRYRVVAQPPGLLVLQRTDAPSGRDRVMMAGEIFGEGRVVELIGMIAGNGWRGRLALRTGEAVRRLQFDQSALKAAYSNVPTERLGEVMVSRGLITPDQLARCVLSVSRERRFGEIAIEQGLIERPQLFEMLQAQAERIFRNAMLASQGSYAFTLPPEDDDTTAVPLHLPVQGLLLESVQRIDEMALFRERIPSGELCPVILDAAAGLSLTESQRPVAMLSDGRRSIVEIGRELRLDEFAITKRVMELLQIGFVELKDKRGVDRGGVERIVRLLNDVLREINDTVERHGGQREMRWTLKQWIKDANISRYFGDEISLEGRIGVAATIGHLERLHHERPNEALHQAAHELVSFAMFAAGPTLPRDAERALSKWVNQRVTRMRL